jgi:CheY-like chemotaxis protein
MVAELGFDADEAASGAEAVDRARRRAYDVVLMDLQLPDIDGWEATRRIRAVQRGKPPVVLALSASIMAGDEARCREGGMDGCLAKPLRLETLAAALRPLASGACSSDAQDRSVQRPS